MHNNLLECIITLLYIHQQDRELNRYAELTTLSTISIVVYDMRSYTSILFFLVGVSMAVWPEDDEWPPYDPDLPDCSTASFEAGNSVCGTFLFPVSTYFETMTRLEMPPSFYATTTATSTVSTTSTTTMSTIIPPGVTYTKLITCSPTSSWDITSSVPLITQTSLFHHDFMYEAWEATNTSAVCRPATRIEVIYPEPCGVTITSRSSTSTTVSTYPSTSTGIIWTAKPPFPPRKCLCQTHPSTTYTRTATSTLTSGNVRKCSSVPLWFTDKFWQFTTSTKTVTTQATQIIAIVTSILTYTFAGLSTTVVETQSLLPRRRKLMSSTNHDDRYGLLQNVDFPGYDAYFGPCYPGSRGVSTDLGLLKCESFQDCMNACSETIHRDSLFLGAKQWCVGAVFKINGDPNVYDGKPSCYLKHSVPTNSASGCGVISNSSTVGWLHSINHETSFIVQIP